MIFDKQHIYFLSFSIITIVYVCLLWITSVTLNYSFSDLLNALITNALSFATISANVVIILFAVLDNKRLTLKHFFFIFITGFIVNPAAALALCLYFRHNLKDQSIKIWKPKKHTSSEY